MENRLPLLGIESTKRVDERLRRRRLPVHRCRSDSRARGRALARVRTWRAAAWTRPPGPSWRCAQESAALGRISVRRTFEQFASRAAALLDERIEGFAPPRHSSGASHLQAADEAARALAHDDVSDDVARAATARRSRSATSPWIDLEQFEPFLHVADGQRRPRRASCCPR